MKQITQPLPLIEASKVSAQPQKIFVSGAPYVVWKAQGQYLVTSAVCPHRGADLSQGQVCGSVLECPYHGWTIDPSGNIFSPFENKNKGQRELFKLTERFGFLWLNGDENYFTELEKNSGEFLGPLTFNFRAPLHITVDNFCDGAHLPYVHARNGANRSQVAETQFGWEEDEKGISIFFDYTQRPRTILSLFNFFLDTRWYVKARIEFAPIRVQYTIYWYRPSTKTVLNGVNANTFYFYPTQKDQTVSLCLMFHKIPGYLKPFKFFLQPVLKKMTVDLINEDIAIADKILIQQKEFTNLKLEKFDAPIVKVRQRLLRTHEFGEI